MAVVFKVVASAAIAKIGRGVRRRGGHVFSREPLYFRKVPKAVQDDPYLEVRKIEAAPEGAPVIAAPSKGTKG